MYYSLEYLIRIPMPHKFCTMHWIRYIYGVHNLYAQCIGFCIFIACINWTLSQLRICRPPRAPLPSPLFCSHFQWYAMCWIKWQINFTIFPIFVFQVIEKIHRKLVWWRHKNDHSSKNKNLKFDFSFYSADSGFFI